MKISVVIPALNEAAGIGDVIKEVTSTKVSDFGHELEVLVVDNGSHDGTAEIARKAGARVIVQPVRGYGNAYKAGFANATGDIIVTGDADMTYPFNEIISLVNHLTENDLDFVTTDRMATLNPAAMTRLHVFGNKVLSATTKVLFGVSFNDSQSGMWVFKRSIWPLLDVVAGGMPFSQELKIEAYAKGFRCDEVPITYRPRLGETKLGTFKDGFRNGTQLLKKRISLRKSVRTMPSASQVTE
jgi:glycosyltransferase involved in cell wall biosynthesis